MKRYDLEQPLFRRDEAEMSLCISGPWVRFEDVKTELEAKGDGSQCPHLNNAKGCHKTIGVKPCTCKVNGKFK